MRRYLSVDCGGTKTAFLLCRENGEAEAACVLGPANYMVNGTDAVLSILREGILQICCKAGVGQSDITCGFIAIAGFGDVPADIPVITQMVEKTFPRIPLILGNDTENALAGSLLGKRGIHIIAGTGSIGLGIDQTGKYIRCGGWHHLFGGDEGSAYWIGCRFLEHFTRQADLREEKNDLYEYVMKKYELECAEDILKLVITEWGGKREKIAGLSKDVFELARRGNADAVEIFKNAADELALIVKGILKQGDFALPVNISYSGGVFKAMNYMKESFEDSLKELPHVICEPQLLPVGGGILLACMKSGGAVSQEMVDHLKSAQLIV